MGVPYSLFGKSTRNKRAADDSEDEDLEEASTSVRKKLKTADYIYQQLFVNGASSDITVCALGKEWQLHKIYLSQSPYFASMFNGPWKEAKQKRILIAIPNKVITPKSLDITFGSLYRDEIEINPNEVTSLVAAATLLQLDCVVSQCSDVMCANINWRNVIKFHLSSEENGLLRVREECLKWLCRNVMRFTNNVYLLKSINIELMTALIGSNDFVAVQGEVDIYTMLKKWIYARIKLHSVAFKKTITYVKADAEEWFSSYKESPVSFLESAVGVKFSPVFTRLRLQNILALDRSVQTLIEDNIIPKSIIEKVMALKWRMQLCIESGFDVPENVEDADNFLSDEDFHKRAIRCGRILANDVPHCWRWSGYYYGVDILLSYKHRIINIKRNCTSHPCPYSVNLKVDRVIYYKLSATCFDKQRKIIWTESTEIEKVTMKADDTFVVLRIPSHVQFPVTVAFWYTVVPLDAKSRSIIEGYCRVWDDFSDRTNLVRAVDSDESWPELVPSNERRYSEDQAHDSSASDA